MARKLTFTIEVLGQETVLTGLTETKQAIKDVNKALSETDDALEVEKLEQELVGLKGTLQELNREQKNAIRDFRADQTGLDSYRQANAELVKLRQAYKDLSKAEKESGEISEESAEKLGLSVDTVDELIAKIQELDKELKEEDAIIGQFQRNVGNYPTTVSDAIDETVPIFKQFKEGLEQIRSTAGLTGKAIAGAFLAFQAIGFITEAIGNIRDFINELNTLRTEVRKTTGAVGEDLDVLTAKTLTTTRVFKTETEETLTATNELIRNFGTDTAEAADLITKSLAAVADRSGFLSTVNEELSKLAGLGIDEDSALAVLVEAENQNINPDVLTEPLIALREATPATVEALERAFGKKRTEELFATFREAPLEAIQEISEGFSQLDDRSQESGLLLADVFKAAGEDDITAVKQLAELNLNLDELVEKAGPAAARELELAAANEELARSQNEVAKQFEGTGQGIQLLIVRGKTFLNDFLARTLKILSPIGKAFGNLFRSLRGLAESLGLVSEDGERSNFIIQALTIGIENLAKILSFAVDSWSKLIDRVSTFIKNSPALQKAFSVIRDIFQQLRTVVPAVLAGIQAGLTQLGTNFVEFFRRTARGAEIFAKQVEASLSVKKSRREQLRKDIENLKELNKESKEAGQSVGKAFADAFQEQIQKGRQAVTDVGPGQRARSESPADDDTTTNDGFPTSDELEKQAEERRKTQEKILQDEIKFAEQRNALLANLGRQLVDQMLANMEDGLEKEKAIAKEQLERRLEDLANEEKAVIARIADQDKKILDAFGEGSAELVAFREKAGQDFIKIQETIGNLEIQAREEFNKKVAAIEKQAREDEQKARLEDLSKRLQDIESNATLEVLKLQESLENALANSGERGKIKLQAKFDDDEFKVVRDSLLDRIDELNKAIEAQQALIDIGVEIPQEDIDNLIRQRQELNTELAALNREQTENAKMESQQRLADLASEFEQIGGFISQGLDLFLQFAQNSRDRQLQIVDDSIAAREESISQMEEQLETATGVEKEELEKQLANERAALKKQNAEKEKIQKDFARKEKAIAVTKAIIDTATAVVKALSNPPGPPFSIPQAIAAGIFGAAQIAIIASQPLAEGGLVTPVAIGPGKVVAAQNIPTTAKGDNVLATVKRGEVVLNKAQQNRLGGANTFKAIGVPGFQEGGLVGPPISAPQIAGLQSSTERKQTQEMIEAMNARTEALENIIFTQQVNFVQDDYDKFNDEADQITTNATLQ